MLQPETMGDIHDRTFSARLDCHYFLLEPDVVDSQTPLVVTLHGFGANTGAMLQPTARLFERHPVIAGLQGPNQFFLGAGNREVGYRWINNSRPAESIRLHHEMLLHVTDEAGGEFDIPPERRLLVGFSQSVGLNYRFVATHPGAVRGVIGICDGLPGDWDDGAYQPVTAAVLHIARGGDVEKAERYDHGKRRQASAKTEADKGQTVRCSVEEECQQASNYHRETRGVGYWQHAVWYDPAMILSRSIRPVSTDLKQENSSLTR